MPDRSTTALVDVGSVRLHVEEHGAGSPVLVLHGFGGSADTMAPVVAQLAARHRVVAPDLVGHGRSDAPLDLERYAWNAVQGQILALLDALEVARVHVFGFSLGGRIALQLAARAGSRVRSVLTVGARCGWRDDDERERGRQNDAALATRLERDGAHGLAAVLRALGPAWQPEVATAALHASGLPLCLVAGEEDRGPLASARAIGAALPLARIVAIPGAGHRAHLERTDEVVRLALAFYAGVEAEEGPQTQRARHAAAGEGEKRW